MKSEKKIYSFLEIKQKIEAWCAYSERCESDIYTKIKVFGLNANDIEALILSLKENNFLDEKRFAKSFVSGKFRLKKWGKNKIILHLKHKNVSGECIKQAINDVDDVEYMNTLKFLAKRKWNTQNGNFFERKRKVQRYLSGKGYEFDLIYSVLEELENETKK